MAETPEPRREGDQHNHGPGIFIAGDVIGDVHHHVRSPLGMRAGESPTEAGARDSEGTPETGEPAEDEDEEDGPLWSLIGYGWFTVLLFGMAGVGLKDAFTSRTQTVERVASVPLAAGLALGGLVVLAFAFAALAEVCAAGAINAAGSARRRGLEGRCAAARLNLRQARIVARWAHNSAVLAGVVAALGGFLAVSRRAAERAHDARECAESEVTKTHAALSDQSPARYGD